MVDRPVVRGKFKQCYADIHIHENAVATVINTVDIPHLAQGLFAEQLTPLGFVFEAGSTGAITVFADATGGKVRATSAGHTMADGDIFSISGTTNYNGIYIASGVSGNDFEFNDTWVANDATGNFYKGDNLTVLQGAEGIYKIDFHTYGQSAIANKDFEFQSYVNVTFPTNLHAKRRYSATDTGSTSGGGIVQLNAGDKITFAVINRTDTTNFTLQHHNVNVTKVSDIT